MFRFRCKLKQITPMIHFQHDQHGATLRATEVKPKLDRFLSLVLAMCKRSGEEIPTSWVTPSPDGESRDDIAFAYKLRLYADEQSTMRSDTIPTEIHNSAVRTREERKRPTRPIARLYFGNQVARQANYIRKVKSQYKETVFCKESIELEIIVLARDTMELKGRTFSLSALIREILPLFFDINGFGTRQTKGFGCFQVVESSGQQQTTLVTASDFYPAYYSMTYSTNAGDDEGVGQEALKRIWAVYGSMRSGFNLNARARSDEEKEKGKLRGYLLSYANDKMKVLNDKQLIKKKLVNLSPGLSDDESDYRLVRPMLGLTSEMLYMYGCGGVPLKKTIEVDDERQFSEVEAVKDQAVMRFASPVRFHVRRLGGNVQILMYPEKVDAMYDRSFSVYIKGRQAEVAHIMTPSDKEFSLIPFLDSFMKYFNDKSNFIHLRHYDLNVLARKDFQIRRIP